LVRITLSGKDCYHWKESVKRPVFRVKKSLRVKMCPSLLEKKEDLLKTARTALGALLCDR